MEASGVTIVSVLESTMDGGVRVEAGKAILK